VLAFIFPVVCLFGPLAVVSLWPYYPFWDLFLTASSGSQFHTDSKILYEHVFIRIAPALFAFFLISKKDLNYKNEALLLFIALLIIYIYGIFSGHFGYGRVISFMVLSLHLLIAYKMSTITIINKRSFYAILLLIVSCLPYSYYAAKTFYVQLKLAGHKHYRDYEFLASKLNYKDVVVADSSSLRLIPAFGGRVTASVFPPYWIPDNGNRLYDLTVFFSEEATTSERKSILDKYHAKFILLDKEHAFLQNNLIDSLHLNIEYQNDQFKLLKTKELLK
jgi:hypothetical protein